MAKITAEIISDWQSAFPELKVFSRSRLFKVIGPFMAGIELNNLGGSSKYRPYFMIYPLYEQDLDKCMDTPAVFHEFYNPKNIQYYIAIEKHKDFYAQIVKEIRTSLLLPFDRDIRFDELVAAVNTYLSRPIVVANAGLSKVIAYRFLYVCSLYIYDQNQTQRILKELQDCCASMAPARFLHFFGEYDKWFDGLHEMKEKRDEIIETIITNRANKKISQFPFNELVP